MLVRAAVFDDPGEPSEVLAVREAVAPTADAGEVVVAVDASVVQPADSMFIGGRYRIRPSCPQVAGLEGTGTVVAAGAGSRIALGTRVAFRHPGAWAERVAVPEGRCYVVPDDIPREAAAQFALNPVTAWALLDEVGAAHGDWIALSAARSAVAQIVARIADTRGVAVVGLARPGRTEAVPYPVVAAPSDDLAARIGEVTNRSLLAGFLDSVGGAVVPAVLPALRPGATIVAYGVLDDAPVSVRNSDLVYRNLTWKGFGIDRWLATSAHRRGAMEDNLFRLLREGVLELPVAVVYPLDDIRDAVAAATTASAGKVLIVI
jgi:NADPH:quinone reductase-like Zn-dependent oxidoreductase